MLNTTILRFIEKIKQLIIFSKPKELRLKYMWLFIFILLSNHNLIAQPTQTAPVVTTQNDSSISKINITPLPAMNFFYAIKYRNDKNFNWPPTVYAYDKKAYTNSTDKKYIKKIFLTYCNEFVAQYISHLKKHTDILNDYNEKTYLSLCPKVELAIDSAPEYNPDILAIPNQILIDKLDQTTDMAQNTTVYLLIKKFNQVQNELDTLNKKNILRSENKSLIKMILKSEKNNNIIVEIWLLLLTFSLVFLFIKIYK